MSKHCDFFILLKWNLFKVSVHFAPRPKPPQINQTVQHFHSNSHFSHRSAIVWRILYPFQGMGSVHFVRAPSNRSLLYARARGAMHPVSTAGWLPTLRGRTLPSPNGFAETVLAVRDASAPTPPPEGSSPTVFHVWRPGWQQETPEVAAFDWTPPHLAATTGASNGSNEVSGSGECRDPT